MKTAILAIILFCIMIFPHELGHFIAAKKCNVQVNEFAFGMGPAIWKKQRGETLHSIRLFPIGGFCQMEGEDGEDEESGEVTYNPRAFCNKKPWQKLIVLFAGSLMNAICAFLIMSIVVGVVGFTTTTIGLVSENTPAYEAGLKPGDKIIAINGIKTETWDDVSSGIRGCNGQELVFTVQHSKNVIRDIAVTPFLNVASDGSEYYAVGITTRTGHNPVKAIVTGSRATIKMTEMMFESFGMLFRGEAGMDDLSGPVGMIEMVSETEDYGLWYFGFLVALICMNLAIVNLLPLPALDGGRILFVLYSWITKKKVSAKVEGIVHGVGIVLLLGLMVVVTYNDVLKLFH